MAGRNGFPWISAWVAAMLVASPCAIAGAAAHEPTVKLWDELGRFAGDKAHLIDAYQQLHARHWKKPASDVEQLLSMSDAMVGRYAQAQQEMYKAFDSGPVPLPACPAGLGAGSFGQWLAGHAGAFDLVMVNEAHNQPISRSLIYQMLPIMREQGFSILALEALPDAQTTEWINRHGYVPEDAHYGFYLREPIEADIVRRAKRLGFTLVNYDSYSEHREQDEADNLAHILRNHPHQKVFVVAGYAHIHRADGRMAALLPKEYGKPFLSIDQLGESSDVLRNTCRPKGGTNLSAPAGTLASMRWMPGGQGTDITVMRTGIYVNNRAGGAGSEWLTLGGARQRYHLDVSKPCGRQGPCLVEARREEEEAQAVPADRYLASKGEEAVDLYLADGRYVVTYRNASGVVRTDRIAVAGGQLLR